MHRRSSHQGRNPQVQCSQFTIQHLLRAHRHQKLCQNPQIHDDSLYRWAEQMLGWWNLRDFGNPRRTVASGSDTHYLPQSICYVFDGGARSENEERIKGRRDLVEKDHSGEDHWHSVDVQGESQFPLNSIHSLRSAAKLVRIDLHQAHLRWILGQVAAHHNLAWACTLLRLPCRLHLLHKGHTWARRAWWFIQTSFHSLPRNRQLWALALPIGQRGQVDQEQWPSRVLLKLLELDWLLWPCVEPIHYREWTE